MRTIFLCIAASFISSFLVLNVLCNRFGTEFHTIEEVGKYSKVKVVNHRKPPHPENPTDIENQLPFLSSRQKNSEKFRSLNTEGSANPKLRSADKAQRSRRKRVFEWLQRSKFKIKKNIRWLWNYIKNFVRKFRRKNNVAYTRINTNKPGEFFKTENSVKPAHDSPVVNSKPAGELSSGTYNQPAHFEGLTQHPVNHDLGVENWGAGFPSDVGAFGNRPTDSNNNEWLKSQNLKKDEIPTAEPQKVSSSPDRQKAQENAVEGSTPDSLKISPKAMEELKFSEQKVQAARMKLSNYKLQNIEGIGLKSKKIPYLNGYGQTTEIEGDGNCQFRAISALVYNTQDKYQSIRQRAVTFLGSNRKHYQDFIVEPKNWDNKVQGPFNFENYLVDMGKDKVWGDENTLDAISNEYGLKIVVLSESREGPSVATYSPKEAQSEKATVGLFYKDDHYEILKEM